MKILAFLTPSVLLALAFAGAQYKVSDTSTMTISGGSSVHDWHCEAKVVGDMERAESGESAVPSSVTIRVAVNEIECGKGVMNKKLRDALDSKNNPDVTFVLDSASLEGSGKLAATGNLTIAGKTRPVEFVVTEKATDAGLNYEGSVDLLMTDFDVKPPTAMLGTMKTKDEVTVSFSVNMVSAN